MSKPCLSCLMATVLVGAVVASAATEYYAESQVYQLRPDPERNETLFGSVGATGRCVNFHKGVVTKVDKALPGSPAAGKFRHGQIVTAVNGAKLAGRNPMVALGEALTRAEATDGVLAFSVKDDEQGPERLVKVTVPVLGNYADTWPLDCGKSRQVIAAAAKFYATDEAFRKRHFAAKGIGGALACLFLLSTDDDAYLPRVKYNRWSGTRKKPIEQKDLSPRMVASIERMITDPDEALWVVDGALMALAIAPPQIIDENLPVLRRWLTHDEWWLRESAFMALSGMRNDEQRFAKVLPAMLDMVTKEYHTMPRGNCLRVLGSSVLHDWTPTSPAGRELLAGLLEAVRGTEVKPDRGVFRRSAEGAHNVLMTIDTYLRNAPEAGLETARLMRDRLPHLGSGQIVQLVATPNSNREGRPRGLYTALAKLQPDRRQALVDLLYGEYRAELMKRLPAATENREALIDTIVDLLRLKHPELGWHVLGTPEPAERVWRYRAFDPPPKQQMHPREKKRFRNVGLPDGMETWYLPDFDDSAWQTGKAPIGVGVCRRGDRVFENHSPWGEGEFLLMRTSFDVADLAYEYVRLGVLARQGFHVYLNGHKIHTYVWWKDTPYYRRITLGPGQTRYLKKGKNVLAVYTNVEYRDGEPLGQADAFVEGLKEDPGRKGSAGRAGNARWASAVPARRARALAAICGAFWLSTMQKASHVSPKTSHLIPE